MGVGVVGREWGEGEVGRECRELGEGVTAGAGREVEEVCVGRQKKRRAEGRKCGQSNSLPARPLIID